MTELSFSSQVSLYVILALIGLLSLIVFGWQINVLRGKSMSNPDGTSDDWHEHKIFFGIACADLVLACPMAVMGIILILLNSRWGFYLVAWISFWLVWANIMTTATSLRFEKPRITLNWLIVFPFGSLVGIAYFVWPLIQFDAVYSG